MFIFVGERWPGPVQTSIGRKFGDAGCFSGAQGSGEKKGGFPKIRGTYYNGESNGKENGK